MQSKLKLYNTLTRRKKLFIPLNSPFVGMYVCGPTVYSDAHLGHARAAITFDLLYRYLLHLGYKVRYVRNITDVGHLEDEVSESGEDKIIKKAIQEKLEPMEIVQKYMNNYHRNMTELNTYEPSIEPRATGHILEQQEFIKVLIKKKFAYEKNGSVYFDILKYIKKYKYGKLSGRKFEFLQSKRQNLKKKEEKKNPSDFALWKKASPNHLMKWQSPWGLGYPGWHLECSTMSLKYLGNVFDIHGGGMDLKFPHHECEMAQSLAKIGKESVRFWIHNNLITINGQKMARSLNNFITLDELFNGTHFLLSKKFSPMTLKFFILLSHYRNTLNFSNDALIAAESGLERLMKALETLNKLKPSPSSTVNVCEIKEKCYDAINDDLNTPVLISHLFEGVKYINSTNDGKERLNLNDIELLKNIFTTFTIDLLGLKPKTLKVTDDLFIDSVIDASLNIRSIIKQDKDWSTSDKIRKELNKIGILIKDRKEGVDWELE
ncbi:MAG: cysteine--tRNA ligase [Bacteroidetes bacterium RBG_13_43_22]|nr:MAG: cysteine--tRNA ligase [Bacteroidetes bacterium RBG_13_43_22]